MARTADDHRTELLDLSAAERARIASSLIRSLGDGDDEDVEQSIALIVEAPIAPPRYLHGTRRRILRGFQFLIVKRSVGRAIQIVAVAHGHRRPGYWQRRW